MGKIKVKVTEPILRIDPEKNILDVSHTAFKKNKNAIYEVPDTIFWRKVEDDGLIKRVGKRGSFDEDEEEDEKETPKPKEPKK